MHSCAGQPAGAVCGHRRCGGLLQRLIGEQPARRVVELGDGPSAQLDRLDQYRRPVTELCSESGDIADQTGIGQLTSGHLVQRLQACLRPQICDIGSTENYDGLTPVTMTL